MPLPETITLENEIALLRPLTTDDFQDLLLFSENEPELWTYSLTRADGADNLKNYLDLASEAKESGTTFPFLVVDKGSGEVAGSTRFYDYQEHHRTVQLGYTWYGKEYQRTALNTNCKYLLLEYAFETLGVERVEFRADVTNHRSITAMKRIGCSVEGILRSNCTAPNGRRSSIVLSILRKEWKERVQPDLSMRL